MKTMSQENKPGRDFKKPVLTIHISNYRSIYFCALLKKGKIKGPSKGQILHDYKFKL